jgi:hypothetical protein
MSISVQPCWGCGHAQHMASIPDSTPWVWVQRDRREGHTHACCWHLAPQGPMTPVLGACLHAHITHSRALPPPCVHLPAEPGEDPLGGGAC